MFCKNIEIPIMTYDYYCTYANDCGDGELSNRLGNEFEKGNFKKSLQIISS